MKSKMIKWYKDSFKKYGENDYRSLTWADKEGKSARKRYEQMAEYVDFENSSVYEVGCGWGSFFDFRFRCKYYFGIDIVNEFIDIAKRNYGSNTIKFKQSGTNIYFEDQPKFDVAIASGVAGNQGGPASYPKDLHRFLQHMYDSAELVLINFPSVYATIRAKNIEYFSPSYLLAISLDITTNVQLVHKDMSDILLILRSTNE